MEHTKEPWSYDGHSGIAAVGSDQFNGGYFTAEVMGPDKDANARRIVACVNACAGIPTEELERGPTNIVELMDKAWNEIAHLTKQRDKLVELLEDADELHAEGGINNWDWFSKRRDALLASVKGQK